MKNNRFRTVANRQELFHLINLMMIVLVHYPSQYRLMLQIDKKFQMPLFRQQMFVEEF